MAAKTPQTRDPLAAASSRRSMRRSPPTLAAALSPPFSPAPLRSGLGAATVSGAAASSSSSVEKPLVLLWEWWLTRVEGEERKLAVSGITIKNDAFTSAPIAKRHEPLTLEDEDGVVLSLIGSMSLPRMRENGFSSEICERFLTGFPHWWDTWDSHMGAYPKCFIHPRQDSIQFYLQKFQLGNFLEKLGPAFIENLLKDYKDNPIDEEPFGPTETCISDETCKETGNQNDTMHPDARELEAGSHPVSSDLMFNTPPHHMPSDLENGNTSARNSEDLVTITPLAVVPPEKANCCSEIPDDLQNLEPLSHESTPVASLNQVSLERTELITLNQKAVPNEDTSTPVHSDAQSLEKTVGAAEKQRSARKLLRSSPRLPMIRSPKIYAHHAPLTRARANSLSISTPQSLKMKKTKSGRVVVPALDPGSEKIVYNTDGMISGISPVFVPPLKGGPARKRKRKAL